MRAVEAWRMSARAVSGDDLMYLKVALKQTGIDFLFYGVQLALTIAALTSLARRQGRSYYIKTAIACLLLSSTVAVLVNAAQYMLVVPTINCSAPTSCDVHAEQVEHLFIVMAFAWRLNYLISDIVVVWRAWVLWPNHRFVRSVLLLCVCASLAGIIAECTWSVWSQLSQKSVLHTLLLALPLLCTNLVATTLVGIRAWVYWRKIKPSLGRFRNKSQVGNILYLLFESGSLYCVFWVAYISLKIKEPKPLSAYNIVNALWHSLAGIYPTFVVLAVAVQGDRCDSLPSARVSDGIHFANAQSEAPQDTQIPTSP